MDETLFKIQQSRQPSDEDRRARMAVIASVNRVLDKHCPLAAHMHVAPYGSFVSGMYSSSSDLDLALVGSVPVTWCNAQGLRAVFPDAAELPQEVPLEVLDKASKVQVLRRVGQHLQAAGVSSTRVEYVLSARVPIIKFSTADPFIEVDICVGGRGVAFKDAVVAQLALLQPQLVTLFRLVKVWAKAHGLNSAADGTFNTWSLTMLTVYSLQSAVPPLLPPLLRLFSASTDAPSPNEPRLLQPGCSRDLAEALECCVSRCKSLRAEQASSLQAADASATVSHDRDAAIAATSDCSSSTAAATEDSGVRGNASSSSSSSSTTDPEPASSRCELLHLLQRFFDQLSRFIEACQAQRARGLRLSVWLGQAFTKAYAVNYRVCVEDPFDLTDNTTRTLGVQGGSSNKLPVIAQVLRGSTASLRKVETPAEIASAVLWLFGLDGALALPAAHVAAALSVPPPSATAGIPPATAQAPTALARQLQQRLSVDQWAQLLRCAGTTAGAFLVAPEVVAPAPSPRRETPQQVASAIMQRAAAALDPRPTSANPAAATAAAAAAAAAAAGLFTTKAPPPGKSTTAAAAGASAAAMRRPVHLRSTSLPERAHQPHVDAAQTALQSDAAAAQPAAPRQSTDPGQPSARQAAASRTTVPAPASSVHVKGQSAELARPFTVQTPASSRAPPPSSSSSSDHAAAPPPSQQQPAKRLIRNAAASSKPAPSSSSDHAAAAASAAAPPPSSSSLDHGAAAAAAAALPPSSSSSRHAAAAAPLPPSSSDHSSSLPPTSCPPDDAAALPPLQRQHISSEVTVPQSASQADASAMSASTARAAIPQTQPLAALRALQQAIRSATSVANHRPAVSPTAPTLRAKQQAEQQVVVSVTSAVNHHPTVLPAAESSSTAPTAQSAMSTLSPLGAAKRGVPPAATSSAGAAAPRANAGAAGTTLPAAVAAAAEAPHLPEPADVKRTAVSAAAAAAAAATSLQAHVPSGTPDHARDAAPAICPAPSETHEAPAVQELRAAAVGSGMSHMKGAASRSRAPLHLQQRQQQQQRHRLDAQTGTSTTQAMSRTLSRPEAQDSMGAGGVTGDDAAHKADIATSRTPAAVDLPASAVAVLNTAAAAVVPESATAGPAAAPANHSITRAAAKRGAAVPNTAVAAVPSRNSTGSARAATRAVGATVPAKASATQKAPDASQQASGKAGERRAPALRTESGVAAVAAAVEPSSRPAAAAAPSVSARESRRGSTVAAPAAVEGGGAVPAGAAEALMGSVSLAAPARGAAAATAGTFDAAAAAAAQAVAAALARRPQRSTVPDKHRGP